jgi:uncharacterized membrane-anchored protein YitT (DUF2179 family)
MELRPHPLAFAGMYVFWVYVLGVSLASWHYHSLLAEKASGLPLIGGLASAYVPLTAWFLAIFVPALIYSVVKISWRYTGLAVLIGLVLPLISKYFLGELYPHAYVIGVLSGILGIVAVELHRRAHRFLVTERGLVMEYRGAKHVRRELLYSRITDLVLEKGWLGKIFGFGNIIPVTASGIGTGEDVSGVAAGVGAGKGVGAGVAVIGGREVNVPRTRSF